MGVLTEHAGLELNERTLHESGWLRWLMKANISRKIEFWRKRIRTVNFELDTDLKKIRVFQYGHESMYFDAPATIIELNGLCKEYYKRYTGFELCHGMSFKNIN